MFKGNIKEKDKIHSIIIRMFLFDTLKYIKDEDKEKIWTLCVLTSVILDITVLKKYFHIS